MMSDSSNHFSSSDEDMELMEGLVNNLEVPKSLNYFEEIVPLFTEEQYKEHFRVSRNITQQLAVRFGDSEYYYHQEGDSPKVTALKAITVFLWFAANASASYRTVADRFQISKSTLHKFIKRVTLFLSNLSPEVIDWPSEEEQVEIETFFRNKNFPGVIGVIDGTHIKINKPSEDPDSYLNRKHFHSIQAQVVCDHKKKIRDIYVGFPGSVHDARVFRSSTLFQTLPEKCRNYHMLGDSAYPCLKNLMTPFKDRGQLSRRQRNYNYLLSTNRYIIEHCFGVLKQRFRQLYHINLRDIQTIVHFVRACAVLHNLCIDDEFAQQHEQIIPLPEVENIEVGEDFEQDDRAGITKRTNIVNTLPLVL